MAVYSPLASGSSGAVGGSGGLAGPIITPSIVLRLKGFGAVGDGSTDDTSAVQAAYTQAAAIGTADRPAVVDLEDGQYYTGNITVGSNTITRGWGGFIRKAGTTGAWFSTSAAITQFAIRGRVTFDGSAINGQLLQFTDGTTFIDLRGARFIDYGTEDAVEFPGTTAAMNTDIVIDRCIFNGPGGSNLTGLTIAYPTRVWVQNCIFNASNAVKFTQGSSAPSVARDIWVLDNHFRDIDASNLLFHVNGGKTVENYTVRGNHFYSCGLTLGKGAINVEGGSGSGSTMRGLDIDGNTVRYFGAAGGGNAIKIGGSGLNVLDFKVRGNDVDGADLDGTTTTTRFQRGIFVSDSAGGSATQHGVIIGNTLRRLGNMGIVVTAVEDVVIAGNIVDYTAQVDADVRQSGIYLSATLKNVQVYGNIVTRTGASNTYANAGIHIHGNAAVDDVQVFGNRCYDDRGTAYQDYGVQDGSGGVIGDNVWIHHNNLRGNNLGGVSHATIDTDNYEYGNLGGDALPRRRYTATATWDPGSVADGDNVTTTITVTGAALGDVVSGISLGVSLGGLSLTGYVSATDTVTANLLNNTGGAVDLNSSTLRVVVEKY